MSDFTTIEAARLAHRPKRVTTTFVGESAPIAGKFFYIGSTPMKKYMLASLEENCPGAGTMDGFVARGWYLIDLSPEPVNHLRGRSRARKDACKASRPCLAAQLTELQPQVIVSLFRSIDEDVEAAIAMAGCKAPMLKAPFPGRGFQNEFAAFMRDNWKKLCHGDAR
jgi:hypothetical protein